jgi:uracil-DNA glycosylase
MCDVNCRTCPRLATHLAEVRKEFPKYHNRPVAGFGDEQAKFLIVGLAPGKHGANRTGRPFTGDYAGILLYETLHSLGFASGPGSDDPRDGLRLINCRITNAVKCLPPENKPLPVEMRTCNEFLKREIAFYAPRVILALGRIAHEAVLIGLSLKPGAFRFGHAAVHEIPLPQGQLTLVDSYHCSRYNTQTRRLTPAMFQEVVRKARDLLADGQ